MHEAEIHFRDHLIRKAKHARRRHGPIIDVAAILAMLEDPEVVRYPTAMVFDAAPLQAHEFAYAQPLGFHPSDGFCLCIHPRFKDEPEQLPLIIAYHIPVINYGDIAGPEHAELFGSALLDAEVETYYQALCRLMPEQAPKRVGQPTG
jgi:hypothetical protein